MHPCLLPHSLLPDCSFQSDPELPVHLWAVDLSEKGIKVLREQGMAVSAWQDLGGKSTPGFFLVEGSTFSKLWDAPSLT